jgi:two-component system, cell cycle sensor histidine kinase and response regulator CckA
MRLGQPRAARAPGPAATAADATQVETRSPTILVVDDDLAVRDATVRTLRRSGYTVLEEGGAERALERLTRGATVSVVLSDIVMPGMGGLDLARAARKLRPTLPFVFISGYIDPMNVNTELGALRVIRKPFRSAELIAQIEAALAAA